MVTRFALVFLLFVSSLFASESGRYAYRAQKLLSSGKFAEAYKYYEAALLASRKEADLLAESRVLLSMTEIRILSLDFPLADSLLSTIRFSVLDNASRLVFYKTKMELENAKKEYNHAFAISQKATKKELKSAPDVILAAFYAEKAYALAALNKDSVSYFLDEIEDELSDDDGRYLFAKAKISFLKKEWQASDSLFILAEKKSITENKIYRTATILYYRALIAKELNQQENFIDFKTRSANAFELMGLPHPKTRSLNLQ